jgi:fatty acid desaturase
MHCRTPGLANRHNGGMSSTAEVRPSKDWRGVLLFMGSLVPGGVALLPLTMGPAWYLSAGENQPYLTGPRVIWMLTVFAIALAPFLGAAVSLLSVRFGRDWGLACRMASAWAFGLGCLSFLTAMVYSGGF